MDELLDRLAEAFDAVDPLVAAAGPGGREIVEHLVAEQRRCAALVRGVASRPVEDGDLLVAYRVGGYDALAALGEPWVLQRTVRTAGGDATGFVLARALLSETLGHGWELSRVTGRSLRVRQPVLDPVATSLDELAELAAALPCGRRPR